VTQADGRFVMPGMRVGGPYTITASLPGFTSEAKNNISVSLGVLNLLPVPVLDGGHLMYYMVEIFKGSPVSEKAMEIGQQIGITALLMLMAFAFYNDINRLITG